LFKDLSSTEQLGDSFLLTELRVAKCVVVLMSSTGLGIKDEGIEIPVSHRNRRETSDGRRDQGKKGKIK